MAEVKGISPWHTNMLYRTHDTICKAAVVADGNAQPLAGDPRVMSFFLA